MSLLRYAIACVFALALATLCAPASADVMQVTYVSSCGTGSGAVGIGSLTATTTGQLCTTGSISATIAGWAPGGAYLNVASVTTSSTDSALPAGSTIVIYNYGANPIMVHMAVGATTVTAATADAIIQGGASQQLTVGSNTHIAYATTVSTSSMQISGGAGIAAGWGGSGSGGGGGNVNVTQWNTIGLGSPSAYGTSPGAVNVIGTNSFVTNTVTVTGSGTAGSAAANPITVQGIASMTPVQVSQATASNLNATVAQPTAANLNATVVQSTAANLKTAASITGNAGATMDVAQGGATAATNALQAGGVYNSSPITLTTGQGSALQLDANGFLNMHIAAGGATSVGAQDAASWAVGSTSQNLIGCEYTSGGATALVTAHMGAVGCTTNRALFADASSQGGTALGAAATYGSTPTGGALSANAFITNTPAVTQSGGPWTVSVSNTPSVAQSGAPWSENITQWAGNALGAPSNYGTSPGAVAVQGVNAFITNTPSVGQQGTWTVQPGNTANTTAWLVTGTGGTFPATQSGGWNVGLLAGSNIAGKFDLLGNAGATMDVAQGGATAATNALQVAGVYNTSAPTLTNGQGAAAQMDVNGNVKVNIAAGTLGGTSGADGAAWTAGTTQQTPIGCEFTSGGATALTTAHMGAVGCTAARGLFMDLESVAGSAITAGATAYGTAPAGNVLGVNAYVTNTNANGQNTMANSSPVVIASNQAAYPVNVQVSSNNANAQPHLCSKTGFAHVTASGNTQVIALSGSTTIYICDYSLSNQATPTNVYLEKGTGTACATGTTQIDMIWSMSANGGMKGNREYYTGLNAGSGNALCVNSSASATFDIQVVYDQY